jgi:hypothetical protein
MALHTNLAPTPEPTISDAEQSVQNGLEALRNAPLNEEITAALKFLTPPGYRPIAQLEEDRRKKRSTAAASNWTPETGEIVIYFERLEQAPNHPVASKPGSQPPPVNPSTRIAGLQREADAGTRYDPVLMTTAEREMSSERRVRTFLGEAVEPLVSDEQIQQLCSALADAEKAGRAFIALKRFRDDELTMHGYSWATSLAHRQAVLARAIDLGAVATAQIPNPKAPQHPTTTVKLNRESKYAQAIPPRFQPIRAKGGASASEIIIRDRGRL